MATRRSGSVLSYAALRTSRLSALLICLWAAASGAQLSAAESRADVLVFGAASLTNVLQDLQDAFSAQARDLHITSSVAASSVLARQIEAGAPADIFFSADLAWMDYLEKRDLLRPGSRHDVVANRLVLIAPADSRINLQLGAGAPLAQALGPNGRLATGDPDSVPIGQYASAALHKLGLWDSVAGRLVRADNVRAALAFVARGEAPLGIVYRTDALAERKVKVVAEFPPDSYPPVTYPIALTRHAGPAAARFEDFVRSPEAAHIFRRYGFEPLH